LPRPILPFMWLARSPEYCQTSQSYVIGFIPPLRASPPRLHLAVYLVGPGLFF
jgi:hypothetical protein